jgi:hypothetical protein
MEPQLRKYGMPTKLNKGVVELAGDFTVRHTLFTPCSHLHTTDVILDSVPIGIL